MKKYETPKLWTEEMSKIDVLSVSTMSTDGTSWDQEGAYIDDPFRGLF